MFLDKRSAPLSKALSLLAVLATVVTLAPAATAQSSAPPQRPKREWDPEGYYRAPSTMRGKTVLIPMGTVFEGKIDQTISSKSSHPGQRFNIVISSPVVINGTEVVIPVGSAVIGEVVEAMPASRVPKLPGQDKRLIKGKLRIQMSSLRTPDGVSYPLVASLAGEVLHGAGAWKRHGVPIGTGVAYMGSAGSFEAVDPSRKAFTVDGRTGRVLPKVISKQELLKDHLLGNGNDMFDTKEENLVRSLVLAKRDYYVFEGSPLSIRLTAPFKIGLNPAGMGVPMGEVTDVVDENLPPPTAAPPASGGRFRTEGVANSGGAPGSSGTVSPNGLGAPVQPQISDQAPRANPVAIPADSF